MCWVDPTAAVGSSKATIPTHVVFDGLWGLVRALIGLPYVEGVVGL